MGISGSIPLAFSTLSQCSKCTSCRPVIFTKACYHRLDETEPSGENDLLPGTLTRPCKKGQHVHGLHFDDSLLFSTLVCLHHLQDICPNKSKIPQNSWVCLKTEDLINYVEQALRLKRKAHLLESEDDLLLTWFLLKGPDIFWREVFKATKIPLDWKPTCFVKKKNPPSETREVRPSWRFVSSHGEWCSAYGWCTWTQPAIRMGPGPRFKATMLRGVFLGP